MLKFEDGKIAVEGTGWEMVAELAIVYSEVKKVVCDNEMFDEIFEDVVKAYNNMDDEKITVSSKPN